MKKGFWVLMFGIFLIFLGSLITLISTNGTATSGVFVIFPFVFIVSGSLPHPVLFILLIVLIIMLLIPFYIFYKLSTWPSYYYGKPEIKQLAPDTKVCPICGTILPINAKYCYNCGYAFKES